MLIWKVFSRHVYNNAIVRVTRFLGTLYKYPHQSLCAALDWSLPPALSVNYLFWQSDKRLFFFCTTHISAQFCFILFNWFALYLPCALCHFIYLFFIFLQCPHLYICIVCMYICLYCIYLYLNVYCQCLMLTVCTKGLRVTQFQFSVCMYCTCGRIDNKADLTWLDLTSEIQDKTINHYLFIPILNSCMHPELIPEWYPLLSNTIYFYKMQFPPLHWPILSVLGHCLSVS